MNPDTIIDLFFPKRCPLCDDVLPHGRSGVCAGCKDKAVLIREPFCLKCGKPLPEDTEYCADCKKRKHYYKQGCAVFEYGSISDSLYRFKNRGRIEYADFYAKSICKHRGDYIRAISPDCLVPVPIHKERMKERGYNQSGEVAKRVGKMLGIPVYEDLVVREKKTVKLKELSLRERQNNLKNAFKIRENDVKLNTIMIIDDIYTTGSTIDEISKRLLETFPCEIFYVTVTIGKGV